MNALCNFANGLNACNLSDTEIGLYSALILLAADRPGITEQKLILKTRERIAEGEKFFFAVSISIVFRYEIILK